MRGAKSCPHCGFLLRYEDPPDMSFGALRHVLVRLLLFAALALFLAYLWAPAEMNGSYGLLALGALALWLWLQPRHRAEVDALLARRRYQCAGCGRRYAGADLRDSGVEGGHG